MTYANIIRCDLSVEKPWHTYVLLYSDLYLFRLIYWPNWYKKASVYSKGFWWKGDEVNTECLARISLIGCEFSVLHTKIKNETKMVEKINYILTLALIIILTELESIKEHKKSNFNG